MTYEEEKDAKRGIRNSAGPPGSKTPFIVGGIGLGVLALTGIALRFHALAKVKAALAPKTVSAGVSPVAAGTAVQAQPTPAAAANLAAASAAGVSAADIVAAQILAGQVDPTTGAPATTVGVQARVTTQDAGGSGGQAGPGDLIIRDAPSASAQQIGGADKDGVVLILDDTDPTFAKIAWPGGNLPAATGFARKAFLALV